MGETVQRIISGIIIASAYVFSFNIDGFNLIFLYGFLVFFGILAMREFYRIADITEERRPFAKTGMLAGTLIITGVYLNVLTSMQKRGDAQLPEFFIDISSFIILNFNFIVGFLFVLLLLLFFYQLKSGQIDGSLYSIGATILGVIYIPVTFSHLLLIANLEHGTFYIWLVSWSTVMSDTMAYFAGKTFGRHKIGFAVSPNKSYEGYIGGLIGQVALTHFFYLVAAEFFTVPEMAFWELTLFATIIFVASVLGDLSESLLKRDAGVKDSGNIIPGHGGVLDLLDALMFTIPGFYYIYILVRHLKAL